MITRVFKSGNSRAVRIPKEFELELGEVIIEQRGRELVIRPKPCNLAEALEGVIGSCPDFPTIERDSSWDRVRPVNLD